MNLITKQELADMLGVKVSYVAEKVRTRDWPSYLFQEVKFGPEHVAEILAKHERKANDSADPVSAPVAPITRTPRRKATQPAPTFRAPAEDFVPLRARPLTPVKRRRSA